MAEQLMTASPADFSLFDRDEGAFRRLKKCLLLSAAGHLAILLLLLLASAMITRGSYRAAVIQVDLVAMSGPPAKAMSAGRPRAEKPVKTAEAPKTQTAKPSVKEALPKKTRVKPKMSLKKKTYRSEKVVKQAIQGIEEKVEAARSKEIEETMARLARQVAEESKSREGGAAGGSSGKGGAVTLEQLQIYKAEIYGIIGKNWSFPEQLAGDRRDLVVLMGIKIMPSGEIREHWFDKRSGNTFLDESAEKAVVKSNPLPPLPSGFREPYLNQGLRFTPTGLQ